MEQKYGNVVLIEFDSIVDFDLGMIKFIIENYNNTKYLEESVMVADDYALISLLITRKNRNPMAVVLKDEYLQFAESLYSELMQKEYTTILNKYSKTNAISNMIDLYSHTNGLIKMKILCKNVHQQEYIKNNSIKADVVLEPNYSKLDIKYYDSIFIRFYEDILLFKGVAGKNIMILDNELNMQPNFVGPNYAPRVDVSVQIADINKIFVMNQYVNFKLPEKIIIKENKE